MKNAKAKPRLKFEVLDEIPLSNYRSYRHKYYDEIIDHLLTLETHQAMKVEYNDFVKNASSLYVGLRLAAKRKKIDVCSMRQEDHITIWRTVTV